MASDMPLNSASVSAGSAVSAAVRMQSVTAPDARQVCVAESGGHPMPFKRLVALPRGVSMPRMVVPCLADCHAITQCFKSLNAGPPKSMQNIDLKQK
jgi:hypothetical protein